MTAPPPRVPRRRLDAAARRDGILEAAARVFAAAPYPEVSVSQVAGESGASEALVFHYFGSKAGLYTALVQRTVERLHAAQDAADAALPDGVPARDRVRRGLEVYLDHVRTAPSAWTNGVRGGPEPAEALAVRERGAERTLAALREILRPTAGRRADAALRGYLGFVDAVSLDWAAAGCPENDREPLIAAALGALEGALGDWGR